MTGLEMVDDRRSLAARLQQENSEILISPRIRCADEVSEQATLFIIDTGANALESKSISVLTQLFASGWHLS